MIAKVYVNGVDTRLVRGDSLEYIASTQFGRGAEVTVKHQKGATWTVSRRFGAHGVGVVGRIRIVEG